MRREPEPTPGEDGAEIRAYAERMRDLEKLKSDFMDLASHELRGPLAIIRGYVSMMEDGSLGELSPQVQQILPILSAKTTQMSMLVNQMLEAARLEDARLHLKLERLDLRQPVRGAVGMVAGLALPGQAVLMQSPKTPVWVMADAARIEAVTSNLLDNAIKYSPGGGDIEVSISSNADEARLQVADRGLGIARDDVPRLFTRFGRVVTSANSHISGTGLGLYLSREVVRMHGGDISVRSRQGGGTRFTVHLPVPAARLPADGSRGGDTGQPGVE